MKRLPHSRFWILFLPIISHHPIRIGIFGIQTRSVGYVIIWFVSVARRTRNTEKSSAWRRSRRQLITTIRWVHLVRQSPTDFGCADSCGRPLRCRCGTKVMSQLNEIRLALGIGTYRCAGATCESTPTHYKMRVVRDTELYRYLMIPRLPKNYIFHTT